MTTDDRLKAQFEKMKNLNLKAKELSEGSLDKELRSSAVSWGVSMFGLTAVEMERIVDEGIAWLPEDRLQYARRHYAKTVAKMEANSS